MLLFAALAAGCSHPPVAELAFATPKPGVVAPEILRAGVEGEHCFAQNVVAVALRPPWRARLADHGRAVADALAQVPEANVLVNASVHVRVEQWLLFQRTCAVVRGDAGRVR
jgi:hypothetical protein